MRWAIAVLLGLALAGPRAAAAASADEALMAKAFRTVVEAMQERAFLIGVCESRLDKAEVDDLKGFLARPHSELGGPGERMIGEIRKAYASGQAQAAGRNMSADRCDRALTQVEEKADAAREELERIGSTRDGR